MGKKKTSQGELGRLFGRPDIERCDLFIDCGFLNWDVYTGKPEILNEASKKGIQMYSSVPSGGHKKCGLQAASGYFEKEFKTILVNDPYSEKWKTLGRPPAHPHKGAWVPCGPAKQHSSPGDYYGTFTKASNMPAFSTLPRPPKVKERGLINFLTNPGKKGNSGYLDICINKYPPHLYKNKTDSYAAPGMLYTKNWKSHKAKILNGPFRAGFFARPYFTDSFRNYGKTGPTYVKTQQKIYGMSRGIFYPPATPKKMGNNHDGCFTKLPKWSPDPYKTGKNVENQLSKSVRTDSVFRPEPSLKTYYISSVVNRKVDVACNERTWRTMKPITYPQFNM